MLWPGPRRGFQGAEERAVQTATRTEGRINTTQSGAAVGAEEESAL